MAIRFVNDIDLEKNEIQNVVIHNNGSDITSPIDGLIYYNTGTDVFRAYANSTWETLAYVSDIPTVPTNIVETVDTTDGTFINLTPNAATDGDVVVTADLSATGTPSATTFLRGDNVWATPAGAYSWWKLEGDNATTINITDGLRVDFTGGLGIVTTIATGTPNTATFDLSLTELIAETPAGADYVAGVDSTDGGTHKFLISDIVALAPQGDITRVNITAGNGLSGTTVDTTSGDHTQTLTVGAGTGIQVNASSVQIDYTGTSNYIDATPTNLEGTAIATGDTIAYHDATDNNVKKGFVSDLPFTNNDGTVTSVGLTMPSAFTVSNSPITSSGDIGVTGAGTTAQYIRGDGTLATFPSTDNYGSWTLSGDTGSNQTISSGNTANFEGGTNINTVAGTTDNLQINLDDSITLSGTLTANGTGQHTFGGQVTIPLTPSATTDAASKGYVDSTLAGSGSLIYQGGYNASTDTPSLDDGTPIAGIKKGWTYTVTADGLFFTEQVRVGDVLIAEVDSPTALADWTTVQNNIDLASTSTVGIASFSSTNFAVSAAGQVTIKDNGVTLGAETVGDYTATVAESSTNNRLGIDVTGATGEGQAAVIGLDIIGQTNLTSLAAADDFIVYDQSTTTNKRVGIDVINSYIQALVPVRDVSLTLTDVTTGIERTAAGGLTTFTLDISTWISGITTDEHFMIQVVDSSTGQIVYTEVDTNNGTAGEIDIIFKGTVANGSYIANVHYCGAFGA